MTSVESSSAFDAAVDTGGGSDAHSLAFKVKSITGRPSHASIIDQKEEVKAE